MADRFSTCVSGFVTTCGTSADAQKGSPKALRASTSPTPTRASTAQETTPSSGPRYPALHSQPQICCATLNLSPAVPFTSVPSPPVNSRKTPSSLPSKPCSTPSSPPNMSTSRKSTNTRGSRSREERRRKR